VLVIRSEGHVPCVHMRGLFHHYLEQIDARLAELRATRRELQDLARHAETVDPAACPEDVICSILVREP
jgi:MerR family copper efflux transcriptional regulator